MPGPRPRRCACLAAVLALGQAVACAAASAATSTTTFLVTLAVQPSCTVSATALAFGTYSGAQIDRTATINATCTSTTPYYINCSDGLHYGADFVPRMIGPGGALLGYTPYRDAARTLRWGNTYNSDGVAATGSGTAQSFTLYGRVAANQFGTPGSYADTLTITVTY